MQTLVILGIQAIADATEQYAHGVLQMIHVLHLHLMAQKPGIGAYLHTMNYLNGLPVFLKFQEIRVITDLGFVPTLVGTVPQAVVVLMYALGQQVVTATRTISGHLRLTALGIILDT